MTIDPDRELRVRLAAHEVLLRRLIGEIEQELPGTIDRLAGPYETAARPGEAFQAFVAEVDDHISLILSNVRADLAEGGD
jgi:hypothetical protein